MNKSDLVDAVAAATSEGKTKVAGLLESVLSIVSGALQKGDKVTLPGFGTFETRKRQARSGRNPRTGAPVKIAATTAPVFKAGATLKASVAGKKGAAKGGAKAKAKAPAKAAAKAPAKAKGAPVKAAAKVKAAPVKAAPKPAAKAPAKAPAKAKAAPVKAAAKVKAAPVKAAAKAPAKA